MQSLQATKQAAKRPLSSHSMHSRGLMTVALTQMMSPTMSLRLRPSMLLHASLTCLRVGPRLSTILYASLVRLSLRLSPMLRMS